MIRPASRLLLCVLALFSSIPARAGAEPAAASARIVRLDHGALAYAPASLALGRPAPLLVLLHGAGGRARDILTAFRDEADRYGVVLLAPASKGQTWDLIREVVAARQARSGSFRPKLAVDLPRIKNAMAALADRIALDPAKTALAGFSDGASYALTVGTLDPDMFPTILAFSPGIGAVSPAPRKSQRVYISHGRRDSVLPFHNTERTIAGSLDESVTLVFRPFDGGHALPAFVQDEAVRYFLGGRLASPLHSPPRPSPPP